MSICTECEYYHIIRGKAHGVMDCEPDEPICERNMTENFETDGGCYRFEEKCEE